MTKVLDISGDLARVVFAGTISSDELMGSNTELIQHASFPDIRSQLWIMEAVDDVAITSDQIRAMAEQDQVAGSINAKMRVAVVTTSPLVFGLARMYGSYYGDGPWETDIFDDEAEALAWLKRRTS